ncbi:MAG: hypothetical protein L3J39_00865 [Verrucomicrobiales bacterium]|nr:hypothetical protein [Verrucomicrobiales bacterium]
MKFARRLAPQHLDLLNLRMNIRVKGCPHCHCLGSVKSHGYLYGQPSRSKPDCDQAVNVHGEVTRALRFFAPIAIQTKAAVAPLSFIGMIYSPSVACDLESFSI